MREARRACAALWSWLLRSSQNALRGAFGSAIRPLTSFLFFLFFFVFFFFFVFLRNFPAVSPLAAGFFLSLPKSSTNWFSLSLLLLRAPPFFPPHSSFFCFFNFEGFSLVDAEDEEKELNDWGTIKKEQADWGTVSSSDTNFDSVEHKNKEDKKIFYPFHGWFHY